MIELLIKNGLNLLAGVVTKKGIPWLKEKTGVDLELNELKSEDVLKLKEFELSHQEELLRINTEADGVEATEITKRWVADASSGSVLSNNIRPISVLLLIVTTIVAAFTDVSLEKFSILSTMTMTAFGAYFGLRSFEKGFFSDIIAAFRKK